MLNIVIHGNYYTPVSNEADTIISCTAYILDDSSFFIGLQSRRSDAAKFAPFWNEIVKNLREEDYLSNLWDYLSKL